jgi:hypothetical protein
MKFNDSFDKYMSLYNEAKEAPKGKHYDKAGRLQSGDADADGRGGPKFRSDPTYVNPNEDGESREFFFGYDIENVHPVEEFVKANYKEGEYEMSTGYGDDVMNHFKVNVDLDDERGKKLLDMIEDCDGEGNYDEDDYDEDNETAKNIGKGALKLAGKTLKGAAKLAGKGALEVAHFATDDVYRSKKSSKEDCESCGCSDEEAREDCETCGCEENPEYGHLDDTYSNYIDQYEPKDESKEDCESCGCEDAEAGCECGNCPDCTPKEDAERIDKDRMKCNSPKRGGSKKFVVKACENGKEKIVRFGDPNMRIKKSNPKARKSFRARHKCDQKKSKFSAGYWSCKKW